MTDVTNEYDNIHHHGGDGGGRNSLLSPTLDTSEHSHNNSDSAVADGSTTEQDNFGDLLAQLLRSLPTEASTLFIKSLSGLSTLESGELCAYVAQLKPEKQFRVIRAMAESTIDGKKKFLDNLRLKFALQREKESALQAQGERELEEHMKRKQALTAAARVKMLNGGAKQFHSMNAVLGAKENVPSSSNSSNLTEAALLAAQLVPSGVARSLSSASVTITKEDIRSVGQLLGDAHIGESEQNLRELEISRFHAPLSAPNEVSIDPYAKRERPASTRALTQTEEKALQRVRPLGSASSSNVSNSNESLSDSPDNDDATSTTGAAAAAANNTDDADDDPDAPTTKRWTKSQDAALRESVKLHGEKNWKAIAELVPGRNHAQCLQRWRKVLKPGLVKGHWSFEEDQVLEFLVTQGCNNWGQIAERIPGRTPKQCRERWKNHLDPAINKGPYTEDEDSIILTAQERLGNKWSQIAQLLQGRTEDSVKIRWKSLKQNPSKAAATHAQHKKQIGSNNYQHQHQQQQQNAALVRQRQLQLLHQQQQLQHNEAAQQLEHVQQLQQQQLQLRLQEKMLQQHAQQQQQQQQQRSNVHGPSSTTSSPGAAAGVKDESTYYPQTQTSYDQHDVHTRLLPSPQHLALGSDALYAAYAAAATHGHAFQDDYAGVATAPPAVDYNASFRFAHALNGSHPNHAAAALPPFRTHDDENVGHELPSPHSYHQHATTQHSPAGDDSSSSSHHHHPHAMRDPHGHADNTWDIQPDLADTLGLNSRLGENPPPSSFWDATYAAAARPYGTTTTSHALHGSATTGDSSSNEPVPLALHLLMQDPNRPHLHHQYANGGSGGDDDFNDAMFEKLATEFGSQDLHFGPI